MNAGRWGREAMVSLFARNKPRRYLVMLEKRIECLKIIHNSEEEFGKEPASRSSYESL